MMIIDGIGYAICTILGVAGLVMLQLSSHHIAHEDRGELMDVSQEQARRRSRWMVLGVIMIAVAIIAAILLTYMPDPTDASVLTDN